MEVGDGLEKRRLQSGEGGMKFGTIKEQVQEGNPNGLAATSAAPVQSIACDVSDSRAVCSVARTGSCASPRNIDYVTVAKVHLKACVPAHARSDVNPHKHRRACVARAHGHA